MRLSPPDIIIPLYHNMRKTSWIIGIFIVVILTALYYLREQEFSESRRIMGTECTIKVYARIKPTNAIDKAFSVMEKIDSLAYVEGTGDIGRINRGEGVILSDEVIEIIKQGIRIGNITNGAFDITIRPLVKLWKGFKKEYIPTEEEIKKVLPLVNYKNIKIETGSTGFQPVVKFKRDNMQIDLSGIAKGYAADKAVEVLKKEGIKKGLVNAGGDIRVFGDRVFNIGIKDPRKTGVIKTIKLKNQAVASSGDYEKYFIKDGVRYHHILDPRTGYPIPTSRSMSVTIIVKTAMEADGLATGIFVLGKEKGSALLDSLGLEGFIY